MKVPSNHNLIVDFPNSGHQRRRFTATDNGIAGAQPPDLRSVHFAAYDSICSIKHDFESEIKIRWNTKQDFKTYRTTLRADVKKVTTIFESKAQEQVSEDDMIQCVGIETFLSESLFNHTLKRRKNHIRSVLTEHLRQEQLNISDATRLRRVSERTSKWSVERAAEIAQAYWDME